MPIAQKAPWIQKNPGGIYSNNEPNIYFGLDFSDR